MAKQKNPRLKKGRIPYLFDGGLDAGLILLSAQTAEGQIRTLKEIAYVCGTSWQNISNIEQRALKKMRAEMARRNITLAKLESK